MGITVAPHVGAWIETSMSAEEFDEMYERIKDVLFSTFLRHISEEEFSKNLISF